MFFDTIFNYIGRWITARLKRPLRGYESFAPCNTAALRGILRPADVILVDGNQRISSAIKYLTQSTWSHAALYIGEVLAVGSQTGEQSLLIEANLEDGVVAVPLSKYLAFNIRVCRPVGLTSTDRRKVVEFMMAHLGCGYDMRHIVDLARYLLPTPPVPTRWRRRMLAFGSGNPTRTICSTLIAEAFESVRYPVLPRIECIPNHAHSERDYTQREIFHIRDHRLFVPRDFDVSPYFQIVKPKIESGFDYQQLAWAPDSGRHPSAQDSSKAAA
jgi:Permuted papain-like amidase enzyme, YaeF/YiiX, C92 family